MNELQSREKELLKIIKSSKKRHIYDSEDSFEAIERKKEHERNASRYKRRKNDLKIAAFYGERSLSESTTQTISDDCSDLINSYYCKDCQIALNSETTYKSHINGKQHKKKVKQIEELASISMKAKVPEKLQAPFRMIRIPLHEYSYIQQIVDHLDTPCPGLSKVTEIRGVKEPSYYCNVCGSTYSVTKILSHLKGSKHRLQCLELYDPYLYYNFENYKRSEVEHDVIRALVKIEKEVGRGLIRVEEEMLESEQSFDGMHSDTHSNPSTDNQDFYCENKRKQSSSFSYPKKSSKTIRSKKPAKLLTAINGITEPIVGLDYIRETQIPGVGENYNCFLCAANCTSADIVDHLLLTKHRIKYLKMIRHSDYNSITALEISPNCKDPLIAEACTNAVAERGQGKVEVVIKHP